MKAIHKSKYFCGNKISDYGIANGYLDYRTLAKAFDAVLVNDITKLFYSTINGEYNEPEQVNGYIDNSDAIDELREQIETLYNSISECGILKEDDAARDKIDELEQEINELEREQDEQREIFQYYIISDAGAQLIQEYTNDPLYYLPVLDCYIWGVTHYGTSWDYVLTDCKLELDEV
jgi:adenine-specific DNA methylase